jgi:acyl CoA:acetate/3-ketoacid CoA transferase
MQFEPRVSDDVAVMDERIFRDEPMKLALPSSNGETA